MRIQSSSVRGFAVVALALLAGGARDNGCLDWFFPSDPPGCPALLCDVDCPAGPALDAHGCPTCACAPTSCRSDSECGAGYRCDTERYCESDCRPGQACDTACRGRCVAERPSSHGCWTDADCADGTRCDVVNFCDLPPGCDPGMGCPPVCYGRCVGANDADAGSAAPCEGAWLNQFGDCLGPADGWLPPECCAGHRAPCDDGSQVLCDMLPPECPRGQVAAVRNGCYACVDPMSCVSTPTCGDGSTLTCRMVEPTCAAPLVAVVREGCWRCVDPVTCGAECADDGDCPNGRCVTRTHEVCPPPRSPDEVTCDAMPIEYRVCEPISRCGPVCAIACEYGHVLDADGCPTCACNPAPPACLPLPCDVACEYGHVVDANGCPTCACREPTACTEEYAPVCGVDGTTYSNACFARLAGVAIAHPGACERCEIACLVYQPVCGTDGVTYGCGPAEARCNGVGVAYDGECRLAPKACASDRDCTWGEKCLSGDPAVGPSGGRCVPSAYCDVPSDCRGEPHVQCIGRWTCETNRCSYLCDAG